MFILRMIYFVLFICNQQRKYVSEAPYLLYSLKEELEMASEQTSEKHIRNDSRCPKEVIHYCSTGEILSDFRIEPVAVKTKSNALNALQLMPTPPELTNQRTHIRRNIVISVTCETLKNQLRERIRRLGVYEYKRCVNQHTKVLVVDNDTRITSNHLKAILIGVRIVGEEWVYKSWEKGCWLNPTNTYCIPKWYRMYKRCKGRGMKNLFAGSELFFVSTGCSLPYETITFLISYGGGKLTKRICEADVVISGCKHRSNIIKFMSKTKPVRVVVVQWVIDSILKGSRRPFAEYEHELTQHFSTAFVSKLEVYDSEIAYEDDDRNTSSESSFTEFGTPKCDNLKVETISISGTPMKLNENECYVYTPSNVNQSTSNTSDL
ncbi:unnamed protein product [Anisakis simplex]|uniref:Microcephalin n=1 Tax=Anisakis simplex TaxID=6269 RepID=A0A0M3IY48_ANISI|nr:unnamed protein product [Anisakis simplex]